MIGIVHLSNGIHLEVNRVGQASPHVLYIHGFGDSHYIWTPLLEHIPTPALIPSLRGFGGSSQPHHYSMDAFAEDMVLLLDSLQIERISVVGHSLGSYIAQRMGMNYPERLEKMILIGSSARRNKGVNILRDFVKDRSGTISLEFVQHMQAFSHRPLYNPEFMKHVAQESTHSNFEIWNEVLRITEESDHYDRLPVIKTPTLILWGDEDHFYKLERQEELLRILPNAKLDVLEGLGHAPFLEKPNQVAQRINAFLAE